MASVHKALCTVTEDDAENTRGGWLAMPLWQSVPLWQSAPLWQADAAGA